jgi:restriction endonuclease Mrr
MSESLSATKAVVQVLAAADGPLTSREIANRGPFETTTVVSCAVHSLRKAGRIETTVRDGERYHHLVDLGEQREPLPPDVQQPSRAKSAASKRASAPRPESAATSDSVIGELLEDQARRAEKAVTTYVATLRDPVLHRLLIVRDESRAALEAFLGRAA